MNPTITPECAVEPLEHQNDCFNTSRLRHLLGVLDVLNKNFESREGKCIRIYFRLLPSFFIDSMLPFIRHSSVHRGYIGRESAHSNLSEHVRAISD